MPFGNERMSDLPNGQKSTVRAHAIQTGPDFRAPRDGTTISPDCQQISLQLRSHPGTQSPPRFWASCVKSSPGDAGTQAGQGPKL